MFYIDENRQPFFEPSQEVIEKFNLVAISEEEWNAIVDELNRPDPNAPPPITLLTSENTVINTNGNVKTASPVIALYSDGTVKALTEEARRANITAVRVFTGRYVVKGVLGTNEDEKWAIEVPTDLNGQPLVWVDYKVAYQGEDINGDGSYIADMGDIVVYTYHRTHPNAPIFAQNNLWLLSDGTYKRVPELPQGITGELVEEMTDIDIPDGKGQFLNIRVNVPKID